MRISEKFDDKDLARQDNHRTIDFEINLTDVVFLGLTRLKSIESFPINSILFATDSGYYVSRTLFNSLSASGLIVTSNRVVIDDESETSTSNFYSMREKMTCSTDLIEKLREKANSALPKDDLRKRLIQKLNRSSALEDVRT